jgi:hypothetical protein
MRGQFVDLAFDGGEHVGVDDRWLILVVVGELRGLLFLGQRARAAAIIVADLVDHRISARASALAFHRGKIPQLV